LQQANNNFLKTFHSEMKPHDTKRQATTPKKKVKNDLEA
jgi:hypothetical protein